MILRRAVTSPGFLEVTQERPRRAGAGASPALLHLLVLHLLVLHLLVLHLLVLHLLVLHLLVLHLLVLHLLVLHLLVLLHHLLHRTADGPADCTGFSSPPGGAVEPFRAARLPGPLTLLNDSDCIRQLRECLHPPR